MEAGDQAAVRDGCGARMSAVWRGDAARRFDRALLVALVVLAALVALSGSGIGTLTAPSPAVSRVEVAGGRYAAEVRRDVAYGPLAEERLDLCRPVGAAGARPGVVLIHGGGWRSGGRGQFAVECALLASRGFVAATIEYRLAPRNHWPAQLVDAQLVDAQLAVRYLRSQSGALGLDAGRLCAW